MPGNLNELYAFCQEEQPNIQEKIYQKLDDGYQKHPVKVYFDKGHLTKD